MRDAPDSRRSVEERCHAKTLSTRPQRGLIRSAFWASRALFRICWIGLFCALLPSAEAFEISLKGNSVAGLRLEFPGQTNFYHWIQWAPTATGTWSVASIQIGTNGTQVWTNLVPATNAAAFFRVLRIPTSSPLDADHDGMDDLYELKYSFLNPLDPSDAQKDQDGDGLYNYGEYLLGTDPTDPDTDKDWVCDGYEVQMGTDPKNPASAPPLEFRINNNALYTSNTTVNLDFGPHIAQEVALSESPDMAGAQVRTFTRTMPYTFVSTNNGWRVLYLQYLRNNGTVTSPVVSRGINLDTVPPVLTIDAPGNGSTTSVPLVHIEGSVSDTTPVQVTINSLLADGILVDRYVREDHPLTPGTNQIVVVATDAAGNSTSLTNQCILDTSGDVTPPSLALDLPLDYAVSGAITNWYNQTTLGDEDLLRLHAVTDERGVTASFTVTSLGATNGPYTGAISGTDIWARVVLFPGTNMLSWAVSDAAGNQTQSNRTIIRDTNFVFRITSPTDMAMQNASSVTVSGIASTAFTNASVTVNGVNAIVANQGSNVTFATASPVPLNVGLTPLIAVAVLNGRTYQADPYAVGYNVIHWRHDYEHEYYGLYAPDSSGYSVYDFQWLRQDTWDDGASRPNTLAQRDFHHLVQTDFWYPAGSQTYVDDYDHTTTSDHDAQITSGSFGFDDVRDQYVAYGLKNWDHDYVANHDQMTFMKVEDGDQRHNQNVILQFTDMAYLGNPSAPPVIDPAQITFWEQPGFWCKGLVSFIVPIETLRPYTITEGNFTWPAFQFNGPRTDMQSFYTTSDVASTRHMLVFSGITNQPEPMEFIEGSYGVTLGIPNWAAVWCKLDLGAGNVSAKNDTVFINGWGQVKSWIDANLPPSGNAGARYSAAINGSFFFWTQQDTTCASVEGFVGTGSPSWTCGNPTVNLTDHGNRWGFGISANDPQHVLGHDFMDDSGYHPDSQVQTKPYGLNNVGLLFQDSVAQDDPTDPPWPAHDQSRPRSLLVWSKDKKDLFMVIVGYHEGLPQVTWNGTIDFIQTSFKAKVRTRIPTFEVGDAIMLDGGTSTQLSFRCVIGDPSHGGTVLQQKDWCDDLVVPGSCITKPGVPTLVHAYAILPAN